MFGDSYREPFFLPEGGEYQLILDGRDASTDPYSFQLLDLDQAPILNMDTLVEGMTLTPGTEIQFYRIEGTAGQRLYFDSQQAVASTHWHLYGPGLQELTELGLSSDFELVLPADGTYYLMLRGENANPVDYQIQVVASTSPDQPLAFNELTTGSISKLGEQDRFTIAGTQGQMVYFDARSGQTSMPVTLTNPAGNVVFRGTMAADSVPFRLNQTGTYTLFVDGAQDALGDYSFALVDATLPLAIDGGAASGALVAGETILYALDGTRNQQLQVNSLLATSDATWTIYVPTSTTGDYSVLTSGSLSEGRNATLPLDGTYVLGISNSSDRPINYSLTVAAISAPTVVNAGFGIRYEGAGAAEYRLTANAGTLIFFDGIQN
ncbi:hypothetical protein [Vacuolonema iberomarrocanum]|uniref:hypothetical protein n=1 Tax=Vacuolonema iberomarrocanum TaxID=3454632 RepID=UPI001A0CB483|nr:hypothetical protein [filamentous cyanobacterium LEGE 07170]